MTFPRWASGSPNSNTSPPTGELNAKGIPMTTNVICPRCAFDTIEQLYTSPVPGVWDVMQCQQCLYCWRTSEPARRTDRDAYPDDFKMTLEDIVNAPEVPAIPPLLAKTRS
jgi:vanillate/4-hydroxybenzoate decarboxylase subunit D